MERGMVDSRLERVWRVMRGDWKEHDGLWEEIGKSMTGYERRVMKDGIKGDGREIKGGMENGKKEESWRDMKVVIYYICEEEREREYNIL